MEKKLHSFSRTSWLLLCIFLVALAAPAQNEVAPVNGDVNSYSEVNISDVVAVINTIAGSTTFKATADVNGDKSIDISDIVAIINIIAGGK